MEVWAGTADCTQDANRSPENTAYPCWPVAPPVIPSASNLTVQVFARDVVRYDGASSLPSAPTFDPAFRTSMQGPSACTAQSTDAAVNLGIYFIPVVGTTAVGTAYEYAVIADTVGPPPPPDVSVLAQDSMVAVSWTAISSDSDVQGYVVYSDPPAPGGGGGGGCSCGSSAGASSSRSGAADAIAEDATVVQCVSAPAGDASPVEASVAEGGGAEGGATEGGVAADAASDAEPAEAGGGDDGSASADGAASGDAEVEAGELEAGTSEGGGSATQGGCSPRTAGSSGSCHDDVLTLGQLAIGAATTTTVTVSSVDAAAEGGDAGTTTSTTVTSQGGISAIPSGYQSGLATASATSLSLTGLTNGITYNVVVASIDGSDNVGPTSSLSCKTPAPVQDFWASYKGDGGGATGCALEAGSSSGKGTFMALGLMAAALAWARRRRR